MRQYELMVIFPIDEGLRQTAREQLQADLTAHGVEIEQDTEVGDRDLAYEIKGQRRGKYILYQIKVDPAKITLLDRMFKLNSNLVKYLFVRVGE